MKKTILTAALFMALSISTFSQEKPSRQKKSPEERAQLMTDHLSQKLSLNEKQKSEVYQINLDRAKEMEKIRASAAEDRKKMFEQQMQERKDADDKINKLLSDDQKKTFADLRQQQQEKVRKHRGDFKNRTRERKGEL
ncbi:hypothetical protein [Arcticibacter sp. MXS-1]|uniref:hypothetical protein n=1 Tax=Arcticibacter sp. MXS-1 TaxID=3341726 RepID=UPI0035A81EF5